MNYTIKEFYEIEIEIKIKDKYKDKDENEKLLTLNALNDLRRFVGEAAMSYLKGDYMILYKEAEEYAKILDKIIEEKRG